MCHRVFLVFAILPNAVEAFSSGTSLANHAHCTVYNVYNIYIYVSACALDFIMLRAHQQISCIKAKWLRRFFPVFSHLLGWFFFSLILYSKFPFQSLFLTLFVKLEVLIFYFSKAGALTFLVVATMRKWIRKSRAQCALLPMHTRLPLPWARFTFYNVIFSLSLFYAESIVSSHCW